MTREMSQTRCTDCGADNNVSAVDCWVCSKPLESNTELAVKDLHKPLSSIDKLFQPEGKPILILAVLGIVVLAIGIALIDPLLLLRFGVIAVPPCIYWISRQRNPEKAQTDPITVKSLLSTLGMIIACALGAISIFIALFALCAVAMGPQTWH